MRNTDYEATVDNRSEELLAIINMIGYAIGVSQDLGARAAASDLQAARLKLASELQQELAVALTDEEIAGLSGLRVGRC